MKLKVTFEKKDMITFGIFAVIVFILFAIGVSNLAYFSASGGEFYGFSPMYALENHFGTTLILYLVLIAVLIFSVKDKFFEFEKGFGFSTQKKLEGYNRWAEPKEIKSELKPVRPGDPKANTGGIVLINDGKTMWVDDGEYHNLIIGSTGSGKTQCIIYPMLQSLAKNSESMIITDPKGEIYEATSEMLRRRGYNIVLLNFRSPGQGNAWNPMTLPYKLWKNGNQDKAIELLDDLALNILYDESNKNADPFWEKTSADYFSGLALGLFEDAEEDQININSISLMSTVGEEKCGGSTYIKEYFNSKDPTGPAYINASSTILAPSDTKGSILAVFKQKIKLFASRVNLSEMLSYSDFSMEDIGLKKTAVFIVIQDEKKTYHSLATILLKQIYETLIDVAQAHEGKLPFRTNFLLDEFANMPPLKDVTTMITAARSRRMRFTMIIQNFAQLNEVYGEQNAETIKGNCGNNVYLISTELKALEEISKMCGEKKSKKDDKTASTPLVTVSDLQKLKQFEVIIRRVRKPPFKTLLTPNFKMNWGKSFPKVDLYQTPFREKREVKQFDVREFVKAKKKEKMMSLAGSDVGGELPMFGGMGGGLPFQGMGGFPGLPGMETPMRATPMGGPMGGMPGMRETPRPMMTPPMPQPGPSIMDEDEDLNFNIDDIVKKIDAKIAEIEAEEKKVKEESEGNKIPDAVVYEPKPFVPIKEDDDEPIGGGVSLPNPVPEPPKQEFINNGINQNPVNNQTPFTGNTTSYMTNNMGNNMDRNTQTNSNPGSFADVLREPNMNNVINNQNTRIENNERLNNIINSIDDEDDNI